MLVSLVRQLDAFAGNADGGADEPEALRAPERQGLGNAYTDRRDGHRLAVVAAVQVPTFLSGLAEGLAGVNLFASDPVPTKQLVAASLRLVVLSAECAQQHGGAPKRRRRGAA